MVGHFALVSVVIELDPVGLRCGAVLAWLLRKQCVHRVHNVYRNDVEIDCGRCRPAAEASE